MRTNTQVCARKRTLFGKYSASGFSTHFARSETPVAENKLNPLALDFRLRMQLSHPDRAKGSASNEPVAKMKVMVIPLRGPITAKFYCSRNSLDVKDKFLGMPQSELADARPFLARTPGIANPQVAIQEINKRMEAAGIWAQWDGVAVEEVILPFGGPGAFRTYVGDYGKSVFLQNRTLSTGQCNIIYVPGIFGARGTKLPDSNLILIEVDEFAMKFKAGAPEDDAQGTSELMKRTIAHEFGHFIGIDVRAKFELVPVPLVNAQGYHDTGKFPPLSPPIDQKAARALMQPGHIPGRPLSYSGPPGRWIRHEDWREANESVKKTLNP